MIIKPIGTKRTVRIFVLRKQIRNKMKNLQARAREQEFDLAWRSEDAWEKYNSWRRYLP